jgi:hypothetical protein
MSTSEEKKPFKIEKLFAYISIAPNGDEGVCAALICGMWQPFVGADMARMDSLKPIAQKIADASEKQIVLMEFSGCKQLEVLKPKEQANIEVS